MAEYPIMPFSTDAYLSDTLTLTTVEHGAYLLLIICMWRDGGSLTTDENKLRKYAKLTKAQWGRVWPEICDYFYVENGRLKQAKLTDMYDAVRQRSKSASQSARAKWRKNKETANANASETHSERNANQTKNQNQGKEAKASSPNARGDEFEKWWLEYPKKAGKGQARKAYVSALKKVDAATLLSKLAEYRECERVQRGFVQNAATWLNGEGWLDEWEGPRQPERKETYAEELQRRLGGDGANILRLEERR